MDNSQPIFTKTVSGGNVWTPVTSVQNTAVIEQPSELDQTPVEHQSSVPEKQRYSSYVSARVMVAVAGAGSVVGAFLYYM